MTETPYQSVKLEGTTWVLNLPVSDEMMGDITAKALVEDVLGQQLVQVRGRLFYENLETIEYPRDWWEALKERWFPRWAKKRWPVRVKHYEINAYYPTLQMPTMKGQVLIPIIGDKTRWVE